MDIKDYKQTLKDFNYNPHTDRAYLIVYKDCLDHVQKSFLFFIRPTYPPPRLFFSFANFLLIHNAKFYKIL
ncbi:Theileria-specific sub-telomeric protein, SVSP family [Caldicellulosiruptor hydrothermalis 108]|uniref:Theileria-specific sub-telomeric protein, SVSP family n=2 Tax=Caldicellulosiruptor TaxID=44000 RepID=E4QCK5_CALH1|nr:hypothetical protein [Caldicellulosiruptor hydrothermalis]ADQ07422.1 Theileria-specific sub-telomeric protein, SVSP family [Caldicellulosiruptor hydrothermalis 108]BCS81521.1 hypothetical protein CaldiYA01_14810 [Caldicellulosiruptor diazotrophicus]